MIGEKTTLKEFQKQCIAWSSIMQNVRLKVHLD